MIRVTWHRKYDGAERQQDFATEMEAECWRRTLQEVGIASDIEHIEEES